MLFLLCVKGDYLMRDGPVVGMTALLGQQFEVTPSF